MHKYFQVGVRYKKTLDNGKDKLVTEQYLFEAVSFSDAETRAVKELTAFVTEMNPIHVVTEKITKFEEVCLKGEGDKFYSCKCNFITIDEKTNKEKKRAYYYLVMAETNKEAHDNLVEYMKDTMSDYEIEKVDETKILDVYPLNPITDTLSEQN
jgi:hypothetical protein